MACEVPLAAFLKPVLAAPSASLTALAESGFLQGTAEFRIPVPWQRRVKNELQLIHWESLFTVAQ